MRMLITAGPTREPIDAVRFISNRSSGKMGLALAAAAGDAGHEVTLLLGPVTDAVEPAPPCRVCRFSSSAELRQLLELHWPKHDVLLMAAAVCDYRVRQVFDGKIRRQDQPLTLALEPTPDLVALMAKRKRLDQQVISFSLEEAAHLEQRALAKLRRKGVDAAVANPLSTMDSDRITPVWLTAHGQREAPGEMTKSQFARWLIARIGQGAD